MKTFFWNMSLTAALALGTPVLAAHADTPSRAVILRTERAHALLARRNAVVLGALAAAGVPSKTLSGVPVSIEWAGAHCAVQKILVAPRGYGKHTVTLVTDNGNLVLRAN
ncbi:MAG: hypothetical protein AB1405_16350 [Bdellovibrionota bacterium]